MGTARCCLSFIRSEKATVGTKDIQKIQALTLHYLASQEAHWTHTNTYGKAISSGILKFTENGQNREVADIFFPGH